MKFAFLLLFLPLLLAFSEALAVSGYSMYRGEDQLSLHERYMNLRELKNEDGFWMDRPLPEDHPAMIQFRKGQKEMLKALPLVEMFSIVRDHLPFIVESYKKTDGLGHDTYANRFLEIFAKHFPVKLDDRLPVYYSFTQDPFQVHGITPERKAVNTNNSIVFNVAALNATPNMTLAAITLLWLHEILHFDQQTPLQERDKWAAQVAQFVKDHSTEKIISEQRSLHVLHLPKSPYAEPQDKHIFAVRDWNGDYVRASGEEYFVANLKKQLLILEKTTDSTQFYKPAYESLKQMLDRYDFSEQRVAAPNSATKWPSLDFQTARWNSQGTLQISYSAKENPYFTNTSYNLERFETRRSIVASYWKKNYRLDIIPQSDQVELQRSYSETLKEGSFETYRIVDKNQRRFISLRATLDRAYKHAGAAETIQVIAKDTKSQQLLSLPVQKIKALSKNEVQLHFEVPLRNLELHQVLIPQVAAEGRYSELVIRPVRPETILGSVVDTGSSLKVSSFVVNEKDLDKDKVKAHLTLQANKKITGISFELWHSLVNRNYDHTMPADPYNSEEVYVSESRKYYVTSKDLQVSGQNISFDVPEKYIQQTTTGPEIRERLSRFLVTSTRPKRLTTVDVGGRHFLRAWVHFQDGSIEQIKSFDLPQSFSLISKEGKDRQRKNIDKYVRQLMGSDYPDSPPPAQDATKVRCEEVLL